jgi:hypothetical protein
MIIVVIGGFLVGCSKGPAEEDLKLAELEEHLTTIRSANEALQQTRAELGEAEAGIEEIEAVEERRRTDEQKTQLEALTVQVEELIVGRDAAFDVLQSALADALNLALNDFPDSPLTLEALTIYSNEAIEYANDAVAKAGDYKKAINHLYGAFGYYEAIGAEPHQALADRIAELEEMRFITKERFDAVKNGMTKDQVEEIAGVPYYQNIKLDEKRGVETWLFKRDDEGVAALYFKIKTGKVYGRNYDAVKPKIITD